MFDGFDQLDKESAVAAFEKKTRAEVRALVGSGPTGIEGLWGVEDLSVLEAPALQYYLEPFLDHLVTNEWERPEDLSFWLSYYLSEVLGRRGPDVFDRAQRQVLHEIATHFETLLGSAGEWGEEGWVSAHRDHYRLLIERMRG